MFEKWKIKFGKRKPVEVKPIAKPVVVNIPTDSTSSDLPGWYEKALVEIGVSEISGKKHNARILDYHGSTNDKSPTDEVPWCAAFVNWCLKKVDISGTNKSNARSYLSWGIKIDDPKVGDIVVFWRGNKNGWEGHVGFYVSSDNDTIKVLGGNQGDKVCFKNYPKSQLLGYRRPAISLSDESRIISTMASKTVFKPANEIIEGVDLNYDLLSLLGYTVALGWTEKVFPTEHVIELHQRMIDLYGNQKVKVV